MVALDSPVPCEETQAGEERCSACASIELGYRIFANKGPGQLIEGGVCMIPDLANACGVFEENRPLFFKNIPFDILENGNAI